MKITRIVILLFIGLIIGIGICFFVFDIIGIYNGTRVFNTAKLISVIGVIVTFCGFIASFAGVYYAIKHYKKEVDLAITQYNDNIEKEKTRATLQSFPSIRSENQEVFAKYLKEDNDGKNLIIKSYLSQMEHFAVGINVDAYDINIVNRMSGGMLIRQYEKYIKDNIEKRRQKKQYIVKTDRMYCEYIEMMKKLYQVRGRKWVD